MAPRCDGYAGGQVFARNENVVIDLFNALPLVTKKRVAIVAPDETSASQNGRPVSEKFQRGLKTRREVMGDSNVDAALGKATNFTWPMQQLVTEYCWDEIWNRPGLVEIDLLARSSFVWNDVSGVCGYSRRAGRSGSLSEGKLASKAGLQLFLGRRRQKVEVASM